MTPSASSSRPAGAPPARQLPGWTGWALGLSALALYLVSATPYLVGADNGEFVILAAQGGRAHPPGYPLYVLYLQAMAGLPAKNPIHAAALATALLGALSVAVVFRAARAWGASDSASLLAAGGLAVSPQFWFLNTHAEAFGPNHLIAALLIWLAAPRGPCRGAVRMAALGLVAGAGLSHHHSIVLLAPVGLFGVYLGWREAAHPLRALGISAAALLTGLLPYLQLLSATGHPELLQWGNISTFPDVLGHFLRRDYGTATLAPDAGAPMPLAHLLVFLREVSADLVVIGALLGALGLLQAATRFDLRRILRDLTLQDLPRERGIGWLAASFMLSGPLFVMLFNLETEGVGLEVVRRFYTLPELLLTVFIALGVDALRPLWQPQSRLARTTITLAIFGLLASTSWLRLTAYYQPVLQDYAQNTLRPLQKNAILVGSGDARFLSLAYALRVEQVRPDVLFIHSNLLRFDWYAAQVQADLLGRHARIVALHAPVSLHALAGALRATDLPIYWTDQAREERPEGFNFVPFGTTLQLLPDEAARPGATQILAQNQQIFADFQLAEPPARALNPWGWDLFATYPRTWFEIAELCARAADPSCQTQALARAEAFNPAD